jgi:hypothetical protein
VNVLVFISFFAWGMSWKNPLRTEDERWTGRGNGNGNGNGHGNGNGNGHGNGDGKGAVRGAGS